MRDLRPHKKYSQAFNKLLSFAIEREIYVCSFRFKSSMNGVWRYEAGNEIIFIDTYRTKGKKLLFVLAHEIGHSVLHKGKINRTAYFKFGSHYNAIEREADEYATRLLKMLKIDTAQRAREVA